MPQVIALGDVNLDMVAYLARYPPPGGDGLAKALVIRAGGSAANAARALAGCGISSGLIGRTGTGALADQLLDELRASGVDLSQVQRDASRASGLVFVAVTPDGQRTMFSHRGANAGTSPNGLDPAAIRSARWLHLSGYALLEPPQADAAWRALVIARHAGLEVSLDPGPELALRQPAAVGALLPYLTALLPNADECRALVGSDDPAEAIARLRQAGLPVAALKLGEGGCLVADGGEVCHVPAFAVGVADTTGAGDAFAAGFIGGRLRGLSLRACGLWANAMGAMAAASAGSGGFEQQALTSFLQEHGRQRRWKGWNDKFDAVLAALG